DAQPAVPGLADLPGLAGEGEPGRLEQATVDGAHGAPPVRSRVHRSTGTAAIARGPASGRARVPAAGAAPTGADPARSPDGRAGPARIPVRERPQGRRRG